MKGIGSIKDNNRGVAPLAIAVAAILVIAVAAVGVYYVLDDDNEEGTNDTLIESLTIDGIIGPVAGASPSAAGDTAEASAATEWFVGTEKFTDETFDYDTTYNVKITYTAKEGYFFGDETAISGLDGASKSIDDGKLIVTKEFASTGPATPVEIADADITGVTVPKAGEAPAAVADDLTDANASVVWYESDGETEFTGSKFASNTAYTVKITYTPNANCYFAETVEVTYEGAGTMTNEMDGDDLVVTIEFPATGDEEISSITFDGIVEPVAGETPSADVTTAADGVTVDSVAWEDANGNTLAADFGYDQVYKMIITVSVGEGYAFAENVAIEGYPEAVVDAGAGTITIEFPATEKQTISSVNIDGISAPVTSETPGTATSDTLGVTVSDSEWDPVDEAFEAEQAYTVIITIAADAGYEFASEVTVEGITGSESLDVQIVDGNLVITVVFPATE